MHGLIAECHYECVIFSVFQAHIEKTFEKYSSVQGLIQSRQSCLRKLADKLVRPVQLVTPRPENTPRSKSPLFSPKHGMYQFKALEKAKFILITKQLPELFEQNVATLTDLVPKHLNSIHF